MSSNPYVSSGLGIQAPQPTDAVSSGIDGTHQTTTEFDLPNGKIATVSIRAGLDGPEDQASQVQAFYETVYPPSITQPLEKEVAALTERFRDISGYDREGQPLFRVQGRDREKLEMKLANRINALELAKRDRAHAERVQAEAKKRQHEMGERIETAAATRAQELIEQAEIERRAAQIAARAGVRPGSAKA